MITTNFNRKLNILYKSFSIDSMNIVHLRLSTELQTILYEVL